MKCLRCNPMCCSQKESPQHSGPPLQENTHWTWLSSFISRFCSFAKDILCSSCHPQKNKLYHGFVTLQYSFSFPKTSLAFKTFSRQPELHETPVWRTREQRLAGQKVFDLQVHFFQGKQDLLFLAPITTAPYGEQSVNQYLRKGLIKPDKHLFRSVMCLMQRPHINFICLNW